MQTCIFSSVRSQHLTGDVKNITLVCYNKNACKNRKENDILKTEGMIFVGKIIRKRGTHCILKLAEEKGAAIRYQILQLN